MSGAVIDCLKFAHRRLQDLDGLGDEGLKAKPLERQQLIQEFLFHLVASIQFLAQDVNQLRGLSIAPLDVTPVVVCRKLQNGDSVKDLLLDLHPKTRNKSLPAKPYSVQGMHFRIIITRNYVCHVGTTPFLFRQGGNGPAVSLFLDLREHLPKASSKPAIGELQEFLKLVDAKCKRILTLL